MQPEYHWRSSLILANGSYLMIAEQASEIIDILNGTDGLPKLINATIQVQAPGPNGPQTTWRRATIYACELAGVIDVENPA